MEMIENCQKEIGVISGSTEIRYTEFYLNL